HQARGIDGKLLKVVHRDLTPSNIIVTAQGVVKILDFGIAKGVDTHSFTQTGRYSGKLNYMPPEQLRGERGLDARADIFSVAVILVESAIGERFWGNETGPMVAARLGQGDLPSLDNPRLDPELREICKRALSPIREDRYPTAAALKADLVRYANATCGLADRDEIATYVCDLIGDDRERLQTVIDGQLQRISQVSFGTNVPPDLPRFERSTTLHNEQTFKQARGATVKEASDDDVDIIVSVEDQLPAAGSISGVVPALSRTRTLRVRSRAPLYAAIAGAAVTLGIVIAVSMHGPSAADATASRATTAQQAPTPPPAAAAPAVPTSSKLEVIVSPPEASLTMDGAALGTNPFVGSLARDGKIHELVIKANGYITLVRRFTLDQDLMLQLRLEAAPPPQPPVVAVTPSARPTAKSRAPAHVVAARPAPPLPPTPVPPVVTPPPTATEADTKRKIDGDVFDSKPSKRALDGNVYDDGKTKTSIDRDNPWK
ncbi:MAG TPA: protein kinase, partial [Kofleriaceae bacterium]|nr:protein kinase [Kofleriaceae bacterium]